MFSVGQTVYHKTRKLSGTVQECDGDTVYVMLSNGVEIDLPSRDLTLDPAVDKAAVAAVQASEFRLLTAREITPDHQKLLSIIPVRTLQAIAALYERRSKTTRFSALDVATRLNYIAEVTATPYRTMQKFSDRPSELGLMMAKGLSRSVDMGMFRAMLK